LVKTDYNSVATKINYYLLGINLATRTNYFSSFIGTNCFSNFLITKIVCFKIEARNYYFAIDIDYSINYFADFKANHFKNTYQVNY
jgi:hypothetical protein